MVLVVMFTIRGRTFDISREDVERVLEKLDPEPLRGRAKYYIDYRGKRYPIKQVISAVTGLPRVAFTAMHAYRVLSALGFEVKELSSEEGT
jgi:hypothetical protein